MNNPWANLSPYQKRIAVEGLKYGASKLGQWYFQKPPKSGIRKKSTNKYGGLLSSLRKEKKYYDTDVVATIATTAGNLLSNSIVAGITQGLTANTRIGKTVYPKGINLTFTLELPASNAAGSGSDVVRIIVFEDKQSNGAAATVANLLTNLAYDSYRNLEQVKRFRFLMDQTYQLNALGSADSNNNTFTPVNVLVKKNINFKKPCAIEYDASTGAITDLTSCNFGVAIISKNGKITVKQRCRLRYTD